MKRIESLFHNDIVLACIVGLIIGSPFAWHVYAQQPKPESQPITLSAEASAQWLENQRQINELQQTIDNLRLKQQILAAKAQVPDDYTVRPMLDAQRRVVYVPPPKAEAAKANPEKK